MQQQRLSDTSSTIYAKTPTVADLTYPPQFATEDEAIEWMTLRRESTNYNTWQVSWALSQLVPPDAKYGDEALRKLCYELDLDPSTGGRMRWMGATWSLDIVRRFDRLKHTHYLPATRAMAHALEEAMRTGDHTPVEAILDILDEANEGEETPSGRIKAKPVSWIKKEIREKIDGITSDATGNDVAKVTGLIAHDVLYDEDGTGYFVTCLIHANEVVWNDVGKKLA